MKSILLIGLGRFGRHIAQELNELGHQVMAIDSNEDRVNAVLSGQYVGDLPPQRRCRIFRAARGWFCGQECCHNCRNVFDTVLSRCLCHCYGRAIADGSLFV